MLALEGTHLAAPRFLARLRKPLWEQLRGAATTAHPCHRPCCLLRDAGWVTQDGGGNTQLPEGAQDSCGKT